MQRDVTAGHRCWQTENVNGSDCDYAAARDLALCSEDCVRDFDVPRDFATCCATQTENDCVNPSANDYRQQRGHKMHSDKYVKTSHCCYILKNSP